MLASLLVSSALAAPTVTLRVVPAARVVAPGEPVDVAVVARIPRGWHIYWQNPGQSGIPTDLVLTAGTATVTGPHWPVPARFEADGLVNYGYADEVAFVYTVTPATAGRTPLTVTGDWLLCKQACIPGSGTAAGRITVREGAPDADPSPSRAALPRPFAESGGTATVADGRLLLRLPRPMDLFPPLALEPEWAPVVSRPDGAFVVDAPLPSAPTFLVLGEGQGRGYVLPLPSKPPPGPPPKELP